MKTFSKIVGKPPYFSKNATIESISNALRTAEESFSEIEEVLDSVRRRDPIAEIERKVEVIHIKFSGMAENIQGMREH